MEMQPLDFAASYSKMSELELMALARVYDSLTDDAQAALRAEFSKRSLEPPLLEPEQLPEEHTLVTIRRYRDLSEAIVARSLLESAGIPVYLRMRTWSGWTGKCRTSSGAFACRSKATMSQPRWNY